jgi:hypothetical protein
VAASNIARWDGIEGKWYALGAGVNGEVDAIALTCTGVYVGGNFTEAGGAPARYVARWDGRSWAALDGARVGSPLMGSVSALAVMGSDLYAGGNWIHYQMPGDCLARWDGTSWSAVGEGVDDAVYAMAVQGSELYAGGWFSEAGDAQANHVARWDGRRWDALGAGTPDIVYAMAMNSVTGELYVGGAFE